MRHLILALAFLAAPAAAQPVPVEVHLSNFKFEPSAIEMKAGQDTVLTLVNDGGGGHSFSAKEFFAASAVAPADAALLKNGTVEVAGNASVVLHFRAPRAGAYKVKCTHAFHSGFGMKGEIVVR